MIWIIKKHFITKLQLSFEKIKIINNKAFFLFSNGIVQIDFLNNTFERFDHDDLFNDQFPEGFLILNLLMENYGFQI